MNAGAAAIVVPASFFSSSKEPPYFAEEPLYEILEALYFAQEPPHFVMPKLQKTNHNRVKVTSLLSLSALTSTPFTLSLT
ncbi:MAG: hypothetical protein J5797_09385 [Prevotella sp.]|nr:hypothetical protein [Prevotella sp.]